jgi:hypothetical protein
LGSISRRRSFQEISLRIDFVQESGGSTMARP